MNKIHRSILEDLEAVRENLLSMSDDIWLSIDHNNTEEMKRGGLVAQFHWKLGMPS